MAVHFIFSACNQYESIPVAGDFISLGQLKDEIYNLKYRAVLENRRLREPIDFQVFSADTRETILGSLTRIMKNSSVVVKRLPADVVSQREKEQQLGARCSGVPEIRAPNNPSENVIEDGFGDDVYSTSCVSSERSRSGNSATSNLTAVKPLEKVENIHAVSASKVERPKAVQGRKVARVAKNFNVNLENYVGKRQESAPVLSEVEIPSELACCLCHDIMKDAVLIPCCCNSFCRNCVTVAILEHQKCPQCGSSRCRDSDLLPNRHINESIHRFLNSNGSASSGGSCSSQSVASGMSSEHGQAMSESKKAVDRHSSVKAVTSHISNAVSGSQSVSMGRRSTNVSEKRKMAPLCISLAGSKRPKLQVAATASAY